MPQVPYSPVPGVTPNTSVPGDYISTQASPADFGAQIGQATEKLGATVEQAGSQANAAALQYQQRANNIAIDKGYNDYQDKTNTILAGDPNKPGDTGYFGLQGDAAVAARPGVQQALEQARIDIKNSLGNQAQQLEFDQQSRRLSMYSNERINSKYEQEFTKAALLDNEAGAAIRARSAAIDYNNDDHFQALLTDDAKNQDAWSALHGADPNTPGGANVFAYKRMEGQQALYLSRAEAMGNADPAQGLAFVTANADRFDPISARRLEKQFKGAANIAGDNAYVSGLLSGSAGGAASGTPATLDSATRTRAQAVHDAAVTDGASDDEAWGWAANAVHESGANPAPAAGDGGFSHGLFQANKDQLADYQATHDGHLPEQDSVATQVQWARTRYNNSGTPSGPGSQAAAISSRFEVPAGGATEAANRAATAESLAGVPASPRAAAIASDGQGGSYPDESALIKQTIQDNPDPERQAARLGKVTQALSTLRLATDSDRRDLMNGLPDLQASALGGNDITIPEDRIRQLLPPAQAAHELEQLHVAQSAGQVFKSIEWASPDQVNAAYQDLSSGMGPISTLIHNKGAASAVSASPGTAAPGSDQETPEAYKMRTGILHQFEQQLGARQQALTADPAGYVAKNPVVAAKLAAIDPKDPSTFETYANASLATQEQLGVAPANQHVLGASQAASITKQLMSADPATTDVGAQLDSVAKSYGKNWPQAFGDLVTVGKLPREYQILGSMDAPGQASARVDFDRALQATAKRGGAAQMEADAPSAEMATIKKNLDASINDFRQTASVPGISANIDLISNVRESVKQLATLYAIQGLDGNAALQKATDGILNQKYDFGTSGGLGTSARVPKGSLATVEGAASTLVNGLKPEDLQSFNSTGNADTDKLRQSDALRLVQRNAQWAPTEDDQGLFAYVKVNDGRNIPVKLANGNRLELQFADLPKAAAAVAPPAASDLNLQ